jgi:2-polyprenyl-3-methyl-5-hydroxy-6-metoxy-1,4-benzoquinol methylase
MSDALETTRKQSNSLSRYMNRWLFPLMPLIPVPHRFLHSMLLRDNKSENEADGWGRLRSPSELGRYSVINGYCQHFTPNASVLDVGCSDGILQERLTYGRYMGVDMFAESIARAQKKSDARTRFMQADAATYEPDESFDAIIWNECLYYLKNPIDVIMRYRRYLRPKGIMIVSMFYQTFATRRLFRQLHVLGPVLADLHLSNPEGGAWVLRAYDASLADARQLASNNPA